MTLEDLMNEIQMLRAEMRALAERNSRLEDDISELNREIHRLDEERLDHVERLRSLELSSS